MKTTFLRSTTKDSLILQGLLFEPDTQTTKVVLHIHGMAGSFYENKFLDSMADTFTAGNWAFLAPNTRGHGFISDFLKAEENEEYKRIGNSREIFEECTLDIQAWVDLLSEKGFTEIALQGHSLGSVKAVYYLVKSSDPRISKLILASPPDMVGLAETEADHQELLALSKKMTEEGRGEEFLPKLLWNWYWLSAKTYLDFGLRDNPIDVFNTYDKNKESILSKVKVPILAFFGSKDNAAILPLEEALGVIKDKAKACPVFDAAIIEDATHSYFSHEKEISKLILDWINKS